MRKTQQLHSRFHAGHGGPGSQLRGGLGVKLHGRGSDDAQRAFAADHQVAQVVAGVVLAQAGQAMPDLTLCSDHFQTQAQLAGVAVAHDLRAARVGAQVAANGAAAFGAQAQGKQKTSGFSGSLQVLQHTTGFYGDGQVGWVDGAHRVHAGHAQHDLGARAVGHTAHHQPGVAPLRHDGRIGRCAGFDHGGHFLSVTGSHDGERPTLDAFAPVLLPWAQVSAGVGVCEHVGMATDGAQLRYQAGLGWGQIVHGSQKRVERLWRSPLSLGAQAQSYLWLSRP